MVVRFLRQTEYCRLIDISEVSISEFKGLELPADDRCKFLDAMKETNSLLPMLRAVMARSVGDWGGGMAKMTNWGRVL